MGKIFYPPKPTLISIDQRLFEKLDKDPNVIAELKYNGTRLVHQRFPIISLSPRGEFEFWNREGSQLKYTPSEVLLSNLRSLNWKGYCVLDGELLHTKVKSTKHHIVLFDVIIWNGEKVTQKIFSERRKILESAFQVGKLFENLYPAPQWKTGFRELYNLVIEIDYIEGLVMKRLDAKMVLGKSSSPVVATMWKVRKPTKNYRF